MPRLLSLLALVGASALLASCALLRPGGGGEDLLARGAPRTLPSRSAWVDSAVVFDVGRDPMTAEAFLAGRRAEGFDSVFLMVRDPAGSVAFPRGPEAPVPFGARDCADCLDHFLAASEATGVAVVAAYPVFLGRPARGQEPIEYAWDSETATPLLRPRAVPGDDLPRRNPAHPDVQTEELALFLQLGRTGVPEICLTHLGFPGPRADFSDQARIGVETLSRRRLSSWPEEVIAFVPPPGGGDPVALPGPAWGDWTLWRARLLQRYVQAARDLTARGATESGHAPPRLHLMATGYYPLHAREGLNWASVLGEIRPPWPEAPDGYESTGTGDLVVGVVLETLLPAVTIAETRELGIEDWASLEAVLLTAQRLLPRESERAVLLAPVVFQSPGDYAAAERLARARGWSIVVIE